MEEALMDMDGYGEQQIMPDALPFARRLVSIFEKNKTLSFVMLIGWMISVVEVFCVCSYQLEALDKAIRENTIVYLETGSGKTLIAIMLLRSYAYHLRKPSQQIAVFLVPKVVLVSQVCATLISFMIILLIWDAFYDE
jgi:hypothetical protein